jgi:hypothetical protein
MQWCLLSDILGVQVDQRHGRRLWVSNSFLVRSSASSTCNCHPFLGVDVEDGNGGNHDNDNELSSGVWTMCSKDNDASRKVVSSNSAH